MQRSAAQRSAVQCSKVIIITISMWFEVGVNKEARAVSVSRARGAGAVQLAVGVAGLVASPCCSGWLLLTRGCAVLRCTSANHLVGIAIWSNTTFAFAPRVSKDLVTRSRGKDADGRQHVICNSQITPCYA